MNKYNLDRFNMLQAIDNHLNKNNTIWNSNIPISNAKNNFSLLLNDIKLHYSASLVRNHGIAISKKEKRMQLINSTYSLSTILGAYFSINQQFEQYKSTHFSLTNLKTSKDAELIGISHTLHEIANSHLVALNVFGVTSASLLQLNTLKDDFSRYAHLPAEAISNKSSDNKNAVLKINEAIRLLKHQLDNLMPLFAITQPLFVKMYKDLRGIKNSPTHRRSLQIQCIDHVTKQAIAGVHVNLASQKIVRKTGKKGISYVQHLPKGKHKISLQHQQYEAQNIEASIIPKQRKIIVAEMVLKE